MEDVQQLELAAGERRDGGDAVQASGYLLELSPDWIVLRASENIHHLLGQSHVTLIDEPLGRFVHAQALHDLRNLFSRLSGTTGIARAYRVRLTDDHEFVDVAFQLCDGRVLLEAVPSTEGHFGEAFGTVGGLIAGLGNASGQALLDAATRRMRALTGYDRVTLWCGDSRAESSRGAFANAAAPGTDLPPMLCDCERPPVPVFPRRDRDSALGSALMRNPDAPTVDQLHREGVRSSLRVPFIVNGKAGEFRCDGRGAKRPSFEVHAAAELYAQLFALRVEVDWLKSSSSLRA